MHGAPWVLCMPLAAIRGDNEEARDNVRYLNSRGFLERVATRSRYEYRRALDRAGIGFEPSLVRPGQFDQTGDINAAAVTEYSNSVEHTIRRASKLADMVPMRSVRGTNKIGTYGLAILAKHHGIPGTEGLTGVRSVVLGCGHCWNLII